MVCIDMINSEKIITIDTYNNYHLILEKQGNNRIKYTLSRKITKRNEYKTMFESDTYFSDNRNATRSFIETLKHLKGYKRKSNYKFEIHCGDYGKYRYFIKRNDKIIIRSSETFSSSYGAKRSFERIMYNLDIDFGYF